jgi:hypothetical protein
VAGSGGSVAGSGGSVAGSGGSVAGSGGRGGGVAGGTAGGSGGSVAGSAGAPANGRRNRRYSARWQRRKRRRTGGAGGVALHVCPLGGTLKCGTDALDLGTTGNVTDFSAADWDSTAEKWCNAAGLDGSLLYYAGTSSMSDTNVEMASLRLDWTVTAGQYAGGGLTFDSCVDVSDFDTFSYRATLLSGSLNGCSILVQLETQDQRPTTATSPSGGTCASNCFRFPTATATAPTATATTYTLPITSFSNPVGSTVRSQVVGIHWQANSGNKRHHGLHRQHPHRRHQVPVAAGGAGSPAPYAGSVSLNRARRARVAHPPGGRASGCSVNRLEEAAPADRLEERERAPVVGHATRPPDDQGAALDQVEVDVAQTRESDELSRLSPMTKTWPGGTTWRG